ncbi:MAG TPA: DUF58 domain-containing protein [Chloroflexota bacterium]
MVSLLPPAILLFLLASLLKISFIYNVAYVLFAIYVLATLWSRRSLEDLQFRRSYVVRALIDDVVTVGVEVVNRGWLPAPWLHFHERLPIALISPPFFRALVTLRPKERRIFTYELTCRQRGWYEIGPLTATLGDVFGITTRERVFTSGTRLTVYPKILPLDELGFPSKSPFGHLRTRHQLYDDPSRVVGVRDYQSGDSLRSINWKASASSGSLQVRKLEPAMTLETIILVNVNLLEFERQHAHNAAELGIVVAASIANHLVSLRQEIGLLTNGLDPAVSEEAGADRMTGYLPKKGRGQLVSMLELLGRLTLAQDRPFWPLVRQEIQRLPWGATLVFVTANDSDEAVGTLLPLRRSGFNVVVIYLDYPNPASFEIAQRRAATLGIRAYRVWREHDVDVWRRDVSAFGVPAPIGQR